jgi:hypothetical protein
MTRGLTITKQIHFRCAQRGRKVIEEGAAAKTVDLGSIPRISRLVALAIHMDDLVRRGEVADYAELARLGQVSRTRITQIMNLLHLAPDILEEILLLPRSEGGADPITEKMVRPIAGIPDWHRQRAVWGELKRGRETDATRGRGVSCWNRIPDHGPAQFGAGHPGEASVPPTDGTSKRPGDGERPAADHERT